MVRRLGAAACLAIVLAVPALRAQSAATPAPPRKSPLLKLVEPWPDEDVVAARQAEAEARPLFQDATPLAFTLTADFNLLNKERNPESKKRFDGVLTLDGTDIPVRLGSRGHMRLNRENCAFVPIRLEFERERVAGTVFDGHTNIKLGTHCRDERRFDQFVIREYLAYKLVNLVTPRSFRARLAEATYVDARSRKPIAKYKAIFFEHENDVASRMGGRDVAVPHLPFKALDQETLTMMSLVEYMLGNTDFSIWALHNVVLVQNRMRALFPVPYDFDSSGLVRPPYAAPDARLALRSVIDRLYRGPCRSVEEFHAATEPFRARKSEVMAAVDEVPGLAGGNKNEVKYYLEQFFRSIESPASIKKTFVDGCDTRRARV